MHFDLIVIGSGPAGQKAAIQGAKAGKRVAIVENGTIGGGCVHVGTLPSKSLRESVYRYSLSSRGSLAAMSGGSEAKAEARTTRRKALPDMRRLMHRRDRVVRGEESVITDQLKRNGVRIFKGQARLVSATAVQVGTERLEAPYLILAVGARPVAPPHLPTDDKVILDSTSILALRKLPRSLVVLGAGIIGCEYASIFSTAGTQVTLVDRRQAVLASVDREIVGHLVDRFSHQGMNVVLGGEALKVERIVRKGKTLARAHLSNGKKLVAEAVLVAMGRAGNTDTLGLDAAGVKRDERGLIPVDRHFRTNIPNIYAVGDVVGSPALASTSMEQGRIACSHAFGIEIGSGIQLVMPEVFPYGIYTIPEISTLGKTEEELKAEGADYVVGRAHYKELARGQIVGDQWGLLKLLVDRKTLRLLGVHIVGDAAANLIHIGQAVMVLGGTIQYFIENVFNYPTLAEAYKTAAWQAINKIQGTTRSR